MNENEIPNHRERRLEAGKLLQWSSLSESPSSFAAKACEARKMSVREVHKARPVVNERSE